MYARQPREEMLDPSDESRVRRDQTWFAAMQKGDLSAFEALFRAYAAPLAGFVYRYLHARDSAEDVVQELFLHLWERRQTIVVRTNIRTYLFTMAKNHALSVLRRRSLELRWQAHERPDGKPIHERIESDTEDQLVAQELEAYIAKAVAGMSERSRQVFLMNRQDGLSYQEIADVLGLSVKTVEMHMSRALTVLRSAYERWR